MAFDIRYCFFGIVGPVCADAVAGIWKFAGQKEQVFVHNAVHNQVAVLGKLVGFKHFFVAEPHLVVLSVVHAQVIQKGSAFQIFTYFNSLQPDPCIAPRKTAVCFVINQFAGAD